MKRGYYMWHVRQLTPVGVERLKRGVMGVAQGAQLVRVCFTKQKRYSFESYPDVEIFT